jgi:hypothetical protein
MIDEVEIFNRVLTREEVRRIYSAQEAGKCKEPLEVACPPIDENIAFDQFDFEFKPGSNTEYTMKFKSAPTTFKTNMQNYINGLNQGNSSLIRAGIIWGLNDCGPTNNCPAWQTRTQIAEFGTYWDAQGSTMGSWNPLDFSVYLNNVQTYRMKVNNYYLIASWKNLDTFWIKGPCPDSDFKVIIRVGGAGMRAEPTLEVSNSKGKIMKRIPLREIKK